VWDEYTLKCLAINFYHKLFYNEKDTIQVFILKRAFPAIDHENMNQLLASVIDEEVKKALFYMKLFKTPGLKGYQSYFYQS
jgi:hypothetical protein